MKILVTGGLGMVGRPLLQRLLTHGHHVRVMDRSVENSPASVESVVGDVTDFAAVRDAVRGMQAIIHLAAIPNPFSAAGPEIFRINCAGTFNVYEAAAQEGIRRVVSASSINALGFNFGIKSFPIQYLPVDEEHPTFTTDVYSFSKGVTEEIAAYYWRREGISGVQLRLPGVMALTDEFREMVERFAPMLQTAFAKVLEMSPEARLERARKLIAELDAQRAARVYEQPPSGEPPEEEWQPDLNDPLPLISFGFTDFWTVISTDNAAQALELGVLADYEGSHPLFVADAVNMLGLDAEILAGTFYPDATRKRPLVGNEPLVSFAKAQQLIGYHPESSLDDWLQTQAPSA
jgi:nucleoside-diphosphate-sugar epimerase